MHSMQTSDKPRKLTLSQIVEMLLTRGAGDRSVVSLTRDARGDTQIEVRVSTGADGEAVTVEDAERKALAVYARLREAYPLNAGHDNASVELTRNAKGETQIDVQVKTSEDGYTSLELAEGRAIETFERLRMRYPLSSGYVSATPNSGQERSAQP